MKNCSKIASFIFFSLSFVNLTTSQNIFKKIENEVKRTPGNVVNAAVKVKEEAERVYDRERSREDPEPTMNQGSNYNTNRGQVFGEVIYFTHTCTYDVYIIKQNGGFIECDDWEYAGTVIPGEHVALKYSPGETLHIRVAYNGEGPCGKLKEDANVSMHNNANQSVRNTVELHDWTCR